MLQSIITTFSFEWVRDIQKISDTTYTKKFTLIHQIQN